MNIQAPKPDSDHEHRWMFLMAKTSFEILPLSVGSKTGTVYKHVEYAYLICNGCQTVMKQNVKTYNEVAKNDSRP
jgi:hypothetical protein